ncbi:RCC1 domain-containing protein [Paraliomyxa miuraensis]|uniref:RCC1 domain-containing protein n=1 Tax=Paraliomyxa miuraensis TaxID=376150 RepID=UPI002255694C|nr:hypothetical protein [Paraliomyxa miuraensis]MCX4246612.1 hypothetical protein [Paraliomyxa miuraensis]
MASWLALAGCVPDSSDRDEALALREGSLAVGPMSISLGAATTCVTLETGQVECWGRGDQGRLGQGRSLASSEPDPLELEPIALGRKASMVATNGTQSFALLDDGTVRAFGLNAARELGLPHAATIGDDETPAGTSLPTLVALDGPAVEVAAGEGFGCARLVDGRVQCWGRGDEGQLGRGELAGVQAPADVMLGGTAVGLAVGAAHACALLSQGTVRCWGRDDAGQLGLAGAGGSIDVPAITGDIALGGTAVQVVAGADHSCARLDDGALRCWGEGAEGQLGHAGLEPIGDDETPAEAGDVALGGVAVAVTAGRAHTCALLDDGSLRCWGQGSEGQLGVPGSPTIGDDETPADIDPVDMGGLTVTAIASGALADHTCARLDDGSLRCWGANDHGQVGLGFASPQDPVEGPPGDLPDVIIVEDPDA